MLSRTIKYLSYISGCVSAASLTEQIAYGQLALGTIGGSIVEGYRTLRSGVAYTLEMLFEGLFQLSLPFTIPTVAQDVFWLWILIGTANAAAEVEYANRKRKDEPSFSKRFRRVLFWPASIANIWHNLNRNTRRRQSTRDHKKTYAKEWIIGIVMMFLGAALFFLEPNIAGLFA